MASFTSIDSCSSTPAPARDGEGIARDGGNDILYCDVCGKECSSVLDAGFDPRLHGMAVFHAACKHGGGGV